MNPNDVLPPRFAKNIVVDANGCWLWTSPRRVGPPAAAYGRYKINGRYQATHRFAYSLLVGPIPEGHQIDHLCRVTLCANPAHLEPVTARENTHRSNGIASTNMAKTHCKWGHEFDDENTGYRPRGTRYCKTCHLEQKRAGYKRPDV